MLTFSFLNTITKELRVASAVSMNAAARAVGINAQYRQPMPAPWVARDCWEDDKAIWHYNDAGECVPGARP